MHEGLRKALSVLSILSIMTVLAACGSKSTPAPTQSQTSQPAASAPAPAPAAPKVPQEVIIAQGTDPQTLDPHRSTVQQALNISMAIAEPLLFLDYQTNQIKPNLATEWKLINDTTWQVKLRQGVKFTNGEEFTGDSVKVSFERISKPELKSPATIYVRPIDKIEVVDKHTVNFVTKGPSPVIPLYLTRIGMVPPKYLADNGEEVLTKKPIGTGPYKLQEWVKDERVVLVPNNEYWNGKPSLEKVTFRFIPETSTRMAALKTGEADIVTQVSAEEAPSIEKDGKAKVAPIPGLRLMMMQFNLDKTKGGHTDPRVRQALNYAIDKDGIVKNILGGFGKVLDGQPVSKEYFGWTDKVKAYPYDPAKAKQLLTEAGYSASKPLELTIYAPQGRYIKDKEIAEAVGGQLEQVGVKAKVEIMEWGVFIGKLLAKELGPVVFWGASTAPDADIWMGAMLTSGAAYSAWSNPEFDKLVKAAAQEMDVNKRKQIYEQAAIMAHDQAPFIFLYQQVDIYGVNSRVSGFVPNPDESISLWGITVGAKK